MSNSDIPPEEGFHNCFYYFLDALRTAALSKKFQVAHMGCYPNGVSWEIQHDILNNASSVKYFLTKHPFLKKWISADEFNAIDETILLFKGIPSNAVAGGDNSELDHPAWEKARTDSNNLIFRLRDAEKNNHKYLFEKSGSE